MKDTYIYPAVFYYDEDGISIDFPDLPGCCPCADTTEEAVKNAREALGVHLCGMELDNDEIPEPSKPQGIDTNGGVLMLVDVFMPPVRDEVMAIRQAEDDIEQGNVMSLSAADL